jgi:hypothetical protein
LANNKNGRNPATCRDGGGRIKTMQCNHRINVIVKAISTLQEEIEIINGEVALIASGDPQQTDYWVE